MSDTIERLRKVNKSTFDGDESARLIALNEARALVNRLHKPHELVETLIWTHPFTLMSIKIAADAGIFQRLSKEPKTSTQLAGETGTDGALISRVMRMLASTDVVKETDIDTFVDGEISAGLKEMTGPLSGIYHFWPIGADQLGKVPDFFRETKFQAPRDVNNTPFHYCTGGSDGFWQFFLKNPEAHSHFNACMSALRGGQPSWTLHYPVKERLLDGFVASTILCVDVGGGKGADMKNLSKEIPVQLEKARIVLQDMPSVIEEAKKEGLPGNIEAHEHDFFTAQPVTGARAYFLHSICHDWPDKEATIILHRLKEAMKPGYSKVLLFETVMPARAKDIVPRVAAMDLNMMCHFSALERTEEQWKSLFRGAGLKWVGFFPRAGAHQGIIEAELA